MGFVEVVDVEDHAPLRGGEAAEVQQVAVAARLNVNTAGTDAGQVRSHHRGGAAIEREWRLKHAPVADRDELRQPPLARLDENLDRVGAPGMRLPLRVRAARSFLAQRFAGGVELCA